MSHLSFARNLGSSSAAGDPTASSSRKEGGGLTQSVGPNANVVIDINAVTGDFEIVSQGADNGGNVQIAIAMGETFIQQANSAVDLLGFDVRNQGYDWHSLGYVDVSFYSSYQSNPIQLFQTNPFTATSFAVNDALLRFFLDNELMQSTDPAAAGFGVAQQALRTSGVAFADTPQQTGALTRLLDAQSYAEFREDPILFRNVTLHQNPTLDARWGDIFNWAVSIGLDDIAYGINDHFEGTTADETFSGGQGNDYIVGHTGNNSLEGGNGNDYIDAHNGDDTLSGGDGNDFIYTIGGNDSIDAGFGNDTLEGGEGNDTLVGGAGNDIYVIIDVQDHVIEQDNATGGIDRLSVRCSEYVVPIAIEIAELGHIGQTLYGNYQANTLIGNAFLDSWIRAGDGNDSVYGGAAHDVLYGEGGDDRIEGGEGNDRLIGAEGNDLMIGGAGHDTVENASGQDTLDGGTGDDTIDFTPATAAIVVNLAATGVQNTGGGGLDLITGFEAVIGSAFADSITGATGDDTLAGGDGNDLLIGGSGNDLMQGEDGSDVLRASVGADSFDGGNGVDVIDFRTASSIFLYLDGAGTNAAAAAGDSFTGVENILGAIGNDLIGGDGDANRLSGQSGNDTLLGRDGHDQLEGDGGNDRLSGGTGNDVLLGGAGNDRFLFDLAPAAGGLDRTTDFAPGEDLIEIDASAFGGGLVAGGAVQFVAGAAPSAAGLAGGVFLYNTTNGFLGFDADGGGAEAAVYFFRLQNLPLLTAADLVVVA